MESLTLSKRLYRCEVFTDTFKIEGKLEPMGDIINALDDKGRDCMPIHDATMTPISAHNPLSSIVIPELILNKQNLAFITLLDPSDYEDIRLQTNIAVLTAYTSSFAIQGEFHLGGEVRVRYFLDSVVAEYVPVTNAKLFPLVPPKANIATHRPFVIINTNFITMYHSEDTE